MLVVVMLPLLWLLLLLPHRLAVNVTRIARKLCELREAVRALHLAHRTSVLVVAARKGGRPRRRPRRA